MSNEKLKILEMIKENIVSPQEGLDLLKALEDTEEANKPLTDVSGSSTEPGCSFESEPSGAKKKPRWLYIKVEDTETGKHVNIKLPIALAKAASRFIPKEARAEMQAEGIDLDLDSILSVLESEGCENLVEVTEGDRKIVKICTG